MGVHTLKKSAIFATAFAAAAVIVTPFLGGTSPSLTGAVGAQGAGVTFVASAPASSTHTAAEKPASVTDATVSAKVATPQTVVRDASADVSKPTVGPRSASTNSARRSQDGPKTRSCPANVTGTTGTAPGSSSPGGIPGTTTADIVSFATAMNEIRVSNCLTPIPLANFRYDSCMQQRLFWMADDPSTDPSSAWGHTGTAKRSDGKPIVGCDGDLAGGMNNTGAVVAQKWWDSSDHRASLYAPSYKGSMATTCVHFAMTHGGLPNEPSVFTRAIAGTERC